jgi:probable DNA repair protein
MRESSLVLEELLSRLEAGVTVLTVNKRLARYLRRAYDHAREQEGRGVWKTPAVYAYSAWQQRMAGRLAVDDNTLDHAQALRLWESVIEDDLGERGAALLRVSDAAEQAYEAHQLLCEYGATFTSQEGGEDHRIFLRWQEHWRQRCADGGWDDPALLPARVIDGLKTADICLPEEVWFAGFDDFPPTIEALCPVLEQRGVRVYRWLPAALRGGTVGRVAYGDPEEEVRSCARRVRRLLETSAERIGVIVLDMTTYSERLQRIFREELSPAALLPGSDSEKAFNLSLGSPLSHESMVVCAFELLSLGRNVPMDRIGYLLRSPFIWGFQTEQYARGILDRELRNLRLRELPLKQIVRYARHGFKKKLGCCDILAHGLETVLDLLKETKPRLPGAWARHFAILLDACQWSKDRALNSREYQVFAAWKELLAGMGSLDPVSKPMRRGEALSLLQRLASTTVFQPEGSEGRVQVLGVLEAAGMQFDAVWVLGAHEDALPAPARPHPFIPIALQKRLKMPHADAARELAFAGKVADRLLGSAPEVIISWPVQSDGREYRPSPLVQHLPLADPELAHSQRPALMIRAAAASLESLIDTDAPPIRDGARISGGTVILKDQALCPFRAFVRHRLAAYGLVVGRIGFDGLDRGSLVHNVLEWFWGEIGDWQNLMTLDRDERERILARFIQRALEELEKERGVALSGSQKQLEGERLLALLHEWLEVESRRPPFAVQTLETWCREKFGPLVLQTRIDRIDRLADGSQVIIDYKTGPATVGDWLGERPAEPQLPLYTLGRSGHSLAAVAFGKVRRGECGFVGLGREDDLMPGVSAAGGQKTAAAGVDDWSGLLQAWRGILTRLGDDFARGKAAVDPADDRRACEYCDLQPLCRIGEQNGRVDDGEPA